MRPRRQQVEASSVPTPVAGGTAKAGSQAFFLVGPTAVGKTAVAHWIAEQQGFDILSADSMQVYRGLDIGTAKPAVEDQSRVHYAGIDLVSIQEPFSVGDYQRAAFQTLRATQAARRPLIVTGGTGLYIKCLTEGLSPQPPRNNEIRLQAERLLAERGIDALRAWLARLDPARLQSLSDPKNPRRLIRAIEIAASGEARVEKTWVAAPKGPRLPGLMLPLEQMRASIEVRVRQMYAGGLLEEARGLLDQGLASAPTASQAIGYAEAIACLSGRCTREAAMAETVLRTRRLAKRQMTWFRHQANVEWLMTDMAMPVAARAQPVLDYWQAQGPTPIAGL